MRPEYLALLVVCGLGLWPLWKAQGRLLPLAPAAALGLVVLLLAGVLVYGGRLQRRAESDLAAQDILPKQEPHSGYAASQSCRACHPQYYDSWHNSFHRTMTQVATPQTVVGDFNDVRVENQTGRFHLQRRGEEFWVKADLFASEFQNPRQPGQPQQIPPKSYERRVVLLTGLHHMQEMWVECPQTNGLERVPLVWLVEERRWVPVRSVFLNSPHEDLISNNWQQGCIFCHSVGGKPLPDTLTQLFQTEVSEYGIACEACHGPGEEHIRWHQNPANRYQHLLGADRPDPTIVQPGRLDHVRASEVCGQCHAVMLFGNTRMRQGSAYRPGEPLNSNFQKVARGKLPPDELNEQLKSMHPTFFEETFWPDGMIHMSGREFNGLIDSPCFQKGELSCLTCHSMHHSDPQDQIAQGMEGNRACYQCHKEYEQRLTEHTHHAPDSQGSLCYNCHMPHTSYGLMKALRSHEISSPNATTTLQTGRPSGCNLCHLDQTQQWTAEHLQAWYNQPVPDVASVIAESNATAGRGKPQYDDAAAEDFAQVAAGPLWLLKGHAGQRALVAWSCGWQPAQEAAGVDWMPGVLAETLTDPYATVRYLGGKSLGNLPGYAALDYRYEEQPPHHQLCRRQALELWKQQPAGKPGVAPRATPRQVLIDASGRREESLFERLLHQRDQQPVDWHE